MGLQSKKLSNLLGCLKDKASQSKATLFPTPSSSSPPHLAVLRATTHQPSDEPAGPKHVDDLLAFGRGSRLNAASAVRALTSRLHCTGNCAVALKCLIAVHLIIKHGGFILQDQLVTALNPSLSGRNHLNLSGFRDESSSESWLVSSLVRWYAGVLELLLFSYRILGAFPNGRNSSQQGDVERATSLSNEDLLKEIESMVALVEEMGRAPEISSMKGNGLIREVMRLVGEDRMTAEFQILVRLREMEERMGWVGFGDSVQLVCLLRRLEVCREKMSEEPLDVKWRVGDEFWVVVWKLKEKVGAVVVGKQGEEGGVRVRRENVSESARFGQRVLPSSAGLVRFGSGKWG